MRRWIVAFTALALLVGLQQVQGALIVAGDDQFSSVARHTLLIYANVLAPGDPGFVETIDMNSAGNPATIHRDQQTATTIATEIVSLDLFGVSLGLGGAAVHLRAGDRVDDWTGHPDPAGTAVQMGPSLGAIENVQQNESDPGFDIGDPSSFQSGDSFFDIFFEIDVAGMTLYNKDALRMEATIYSLPPIGFTYLLQNSVDLYLIASEDGLIDDFDPLVGQLLGATHTPTPEPSTLLIWSLLGMGWASVRVWRRRRRTPWPEQNTRTILKMIDRGRV